LALRYRTAPALMFDRFTDNAKQSMNRARQESQRLGHDFLGTEHMLLGILTVDDSTAVRVLEAMNVDRVRLRTEVEKLVTLGAAKPLGQIPFTVGAKKVLELSMDEAGGLGHNYLGTEHLLLGLVKEDVGVAAIVLRSLGVDLATTRSGIVEYLGNDGGHIGRESIRTQIRELSWCAEILRRHGLTDLAEAVARAAKRPEP
jgi:ATP-dependent Clp protease ATP-binding subunit ClpC